MGLYLHKASLMSRRFIIYVCILLWSSPAFAIDAVVSHTLFFKTQGGKLVSSLDLYWQINPNTLHYNTNSDNKIVAQVRTNIVIFNDAGIIKQEQYIMQTVPRTGINEIMQHPVIELRNYDLPEGIIKVRMQLTDAGDTLNRFSFRDSFMVAPQKYTPFYSGIQLVDTIIENAPPGKFTKNGRLLIPFCTNFYDDGMNRLRYYAELYNADKITKADYPLVQSVAISKNEAQGVFGTMQKIDTISNAPTFAFASGSFNLASLPSGNYYLRMALQNSSRETIASTTLFFQKLNKHPYIPPSDTLKKSAPMADTGVESVNVLNLSKTFLAKYDLAQVRAILKMLLPFSDPAGRQTINNFLKRPDEMYMRYYIYNFFANINKKDPTKAWKEFTAKITDVNKRFNSTTTPGYETDRGFIYLRYGPPTDIITVENDQGCLPYQIWQYNVLTQLNKKDVADVFFLFYKSNEMINDYRLLHSNVAGELQNNQWRTLLYVNNGTGDYSNSRAEQYINNR